MSELDKKLEDIYYRSDLSVEEFAVAVKHIFTSHGWKNLKYVTPEDVGLPLPQAVNDPLTGITTFPESAKPTLESRPLPPPPEQWYNKHNP